MSKITTGAPLNLVVDDTTGTNFVREDYAANMVRLNEAYTELSQLATNQAIAMAIIFGG